MEHPTKRDSIERKLLRPIAANMLALTALTACSFSIDSYHTDASNVQCDDGRTKSELTGDGFTTFIVHGEEAQDVATVTIRRQDNAVGVKVTGEAQGPQPVVDADGYSFPVVINSGIELSAAAANAAWVIDARQDSVVIEGTCQGS